MFSQCSTLYTKAAVSHVAEKAGHNHTVDCSLQNPYQLVKIVQVVAEGPPVITGFRESHPTFAAA